MAFRLGIDTGGTSTDLAVLDERGEFRMYKLPATPSRDSLTAISVELLI